MMTTESSASESGVRDSSDLDDPTIWSHSLLDWVPTSPAASRTELLRQLTERDYFLTRDATDAALFIVSPDSPELTTRVREQFAERGKSVRLKDSVRRFAQGFFNQPYMERLVQFNELKVQCAEEPYLLAWLDGLSSGLEVDRPALEGDDAFDRLVMECVEIFVAPPREASRKRQEFIHASREEPEFWWRAAIKLHLNHNQFIIRAAAWTRQLADWQQVERQYQQTIRQLNRSVVDDQTAAHESGLPVVLQEDDRSQTDRLTPRVKKPFESFYYVFAVIAVLRLVSAGLNSNSKRSESPPQLTRTRPAQVQFPQPETMRRLSGNSLPEGASTPEVNKKSDQGEQGVIRGRTTELSDLLLMSPAERDAVLAQDPQLKVEFDRLMKAVWKKNNSAGKSNRSESNDR